MENVAEGASAETSVFEKVEAILTSETLVRHVLAGIAVVRACEALLAWGRHRHGRT